MVKAVLFASLAVAVFASVAHARQRHVDANGNLVEVKTAAGLTARVAASVREKFQGFIDAIEIDHIEPETGVFTKGNRIKAIGCYARGGHMPGSKHYRGLACDIDQESRNVTSGFMYRVAAIAAKFGLTDGCTWARVRGERYTGPDCGHVEVPGPTRTYSAKRRHRR